MWPRGDPRATSLQHVSGELGVTQPRPSRWAEPWRGTRPRPPELRAALHLRPFLLCEWVYV